MYWKTFGPKKDKVSDKFKLHNEEFLDLNRSPFIVRIVKSRL
jgi:hypothetical protein